MKNNYILHTLLSAIICLGFNTSNITAQQQMLQGKLDFMVKVPEKQIFDIAKKENKPILIYIHSPSCITGKKFAREILNHPQMKSWLKKKYVSMNADVNSEIGKDAARKHKVLITPAVFLYSPDNFLSYQCKLDADTADMLNQFNAFTVACAMLQQVKLLQTTSKLSEKQALRKIGESYATRDFKLDRNADVNQKLAARTLNIKFFEELEASYKETWAKLEAAPANEKK